MRSQFTSYDQLPITLTADHVAAALGNIHPVDIYRIGQDDPAKLRGWKNYVFPIYTAYNGKCRKDALPMKF